MDLQSESEIEKYPISSHKEFAWGRPFQSFLSRTLLSVRSYLLLFFYNLIPDFWSHSKVLFFPSHLLLPTQSVNGLFFVLSLIISFLLYFQIFFLVGSLTFFLSQTTFLRQGINQIAGVLGGKWIPIILMPVAAQSIIIYLPFRFLYDGPLKIFQEKMIQQDIILGLVTGSFWLLFFMILGRYVWGKGIKKYEAYGH